MNHKPLPVGIDNFEMLVTRGYYFVDKTMLIKELLDKKGAVNLFIRPRRFGKTLNMSMLQYFFEDARNDQSEKQEHSNPWSVIQFMDDLQDNPNCFPKAYWANTSSNSIVRKLIEMADEDTRTEIEELFEGKTIEKPNREGGSGRSDLFVKPLTRRKPAFVLEFKVADKFSQLDSKADEALQQIDDRGYARELEDDGYATVYRYGIAFCGKDCVVKLV